MNNIPLNRIGDKLLHPVKTDVRDRTREKGESFGSVLKNAIEEVNSLQHNMDESIEKFATGEISDVHDVMIAVARSVPPILLTVMLPMASFNMLISSVGF